MLFFAGPLYVAGFMLSPLHWIGALVAACLTNCRKHPWKKALIFCVFYAALLASSSMWNQSKDRWGANYVFLILAMMVALLIQGLVMKLVVSFILHWDNRGLSADQGGNDAPNL
jgi:uncharacterized membrane protein YjdF